ncbi:MAG TPA: ATP-grasp domain-containing protein, partial [Fimbriiglobus sp.]
AASVLRAGFTPAVVDLFADRDTRLLARTIRCPHSDYPHAIPELARRLPPGPFLYCGGLENSPDVIDELARHRPLWGNASETILRVRDPMVLREELACTGLLFPRQWFLAPMDIEFLVKSRMSSGGLRVRSFKGGQIESNEYGEEFIPGRSMSAQFDDRCFLGVTEQFVGESWLNAPAFHYAGNIGPIPVSDDLVRTFGAVGQRLSLRGPWGLDFIFGEAGAYLLEVNPRYTAAREILELACQKSLILSREVPGKTANVVGKAIYHASNPLRFPQSGPWDADLELIADCWRIPGFADIPHPGEPFRPGQPVITIFASDSTREAIRAKLKGIAHELDCLFAPGTLP